MSTSISASARPSLPKVLFRDNPPNARRTIEALRELGYDSYASVLDLIDNCIDAQASNVAIIVSEERGDIQIVIEDDGMGMDEETLDEALRLGSETQHEAGDLGKFGLGLVTASIGLSRRVEVFSRELDGQLFYGGFDLDEIVKQNRFSKWVQPLSDVKLLSNTKGTQIRLSKTDRISNRNVSTFSSTLRKQVGQVFRKFLKAGLKIRVNGKLVEAIDPLMLADPETKLILETEIEVTEGVTAVIKAVDLPDYGQAGNRDRGIIAQNSGFYILRNNRQIMEARKFDFYKEHPDYTHFRAEILFDGAADPFFHTDVKKSFLDKLRQATMGLITESGRQGRRRANARRGEIDHSVAESNITRRAPLIPKPKALLEKREARAKKGSSPARTGDGSRTPHITDLKTVSGLKVLFEEGNYGEGPFYVVRQEGKTIKVAYNREHPFWRELVEHAAEPKVVATLDYLVFALANAELLVPEQARIVKENVNTTLVGLLV